MSLSANYSYFSGTMFAMARRLENADGDDFTLSCILMLTLSDDVTTSMICLWYSASVT